MAEEISVLVNDTTETVSANISTETNGTVTSVAVTGSVGIDASGSPITSSGTIALTLSDMTANTIKGRVLSNGAPGDLSKTQVLAMLNVEDGATANPNAIDNLVEDTTPQLGGELDLNGHSVGGTAQSATGDGTTTIDWKLGNFFHFQFGAFNETFTFTAPTKPGTFILKMIQDSVGSRTVTWPATCKWIGGTAPTLTTTATTGTDIITLYFDGTNYFGVEAINFS
jgi:hypothetical protein